MEVRIFIFIFLLIFFFNFYSERGYLYEHTTAVCSGNVCRDYLVTCQGDEIVSSVPISGFVTFGDGWEDLRSEDQKIFCRN